MGANPTSVLGCVIIRGYRPDSRLLDGMSAADQVEPICARFLRQQYGLTPGRHGRTVWIAWAVRIYVPSDVQGNVGRLIVASLQ